MDLEIAALESAITAGQEIPSPLFIAANLSPAAITDPRVQYLLLTSALPPERMVIDFTGHDSEGQRAGEDWEAISVALDLLRRNGARLSMDFSSEDRSILRIREIRPDIIKLDRDFISGLVHGQAGEATAAVRGLARDTGAVLVAEGIETQAELDAVIEAGVTAGQGFLLGRPSANPADWTSWVA
jgi:EAL domain-containing protein (putative c-di-GMP-specific phosphodiesterase class I)